MDYPIYEMENNPAMFQTTNQKLDIKHDHRKHGYPAKQTSDGKLSPIFQISSANPGIQWDPWIHGAVLSW
jgi:hypothetical protein